MKNKIIFTVLVLFTISVSGFSDIIPEGKKKISFSFGISNINEFSDYVFLAYPVNTSPGAPRIECKQISAGNPIYLPCKFGPAPHIYAIKKDLFNPDIYDISNENTTKVLDSVFANNKDLIPSIKISCYGYADKKAPYSGVNDLYKIESITTDTMIINFEKTIKTDSKGNIIDESKGDLLGNPIGKEITNYIYYALPFISLILIVTVIVIRKMKK